MNTDDIRNKLQNGYKEEPVPSKVRSVVDVPSVAAPGKAPTQLQSACEINVHPAWIEFN